MADINKIDELLSQFEQNRGALHDMIVDVHGFRKNLDKLLPNKIDHRNKFLWEEKMKTITSILATELSIRKQIDDSIKSEINIRSKDEGGMDNDQDTCEAIAELIEKGIIKVEQ